MKWNEVEIFGNKQNLYSYALILKTNTYVDLSSFKNLKNRQFTLYQWKVHNIAQNVAGKFLSGWEKIFRYKNKTWTSVKRTSKFATGSMVWSYGSGTTSMAFSKRAVMIPAHMFFKDGAELRAWLGEDEEAKLFIEML